MRAAMESEEKSCRQIRARPDARMWTAETSDYFTKAAGLSYSLPRYSGGGLGWGFDKQVTWRTP
jgi:hypothetical protein